MRVQRLKHIDWEPLSIRLYASTAELPPVEAVSKFLKKWLDRRGSSPSCGHRCTNKFSKVTADPANHSINIALQWACDECSAQILDLISTNFPTIDLAQIGSATEKESS